MTALALALQWVVLGLHVLLPWRLARIATRPVPPSPESPASPTPPATIESPDRRQLWAMLAAPLLLAAALAGVLTLNVRLDAALAWGLRWPPASLPALVLGFAGLATFLSDLILFAGFRKLEPAGWRIAAGLGGILLLAASVTGELLRTGRGPSAGLAGLAIAALCRIPLALAAAEAISGPVRRIAALAGVALPLSLLAFPPGLRSALGADLATLGAATLLLLAARFLPPSLRRPATLAGVLLAALFLDRTADLQVMLEPPSSIPDILLSEP